MYHKNCPSSKYEIMTTISWDCFSPSLFCGNFELLFTQESSCMVSRKFKITVMSDIILFIYNLDYKLAAVHKALKFNQAPWLPKYINFNTDKKEVKSLFEKDFFK